MTHTPYFRISKKRVLEQYQAIRTCVDIVSYSSKTNQYCTRILEHETACMFSVHVEEELVHIKDMSRVLFLAQGWDRTVIDRLYQKGIRWFVVDNEVDLRTLVRFLDSNPDEKIRLLLRWKVKEETIRTEKFYAFGMRSETIQKNLIALKNHPMIATIGIHFHRKSQNIAEWRLRYLLENSFQDELFESVDMINIGGGIPSLYANTNAHSIPHVLSQIQDLHDWCRAKKIQLISEPGRFIASFPTTLHTTVVNMHGNTIIVDASVYNGDLDALIVPVKLLVDGELPKGEGKEYVIKGITPCSLDIFRYRVYLPEVKVGDSLVFLNAGAYNFSSTFCDLTPVKTIVE